MSQALVILAEEAPTNLDDLAENLKRTVDGEDLRALKCVQLLIPENKLPDSADYLVNCRAVLASIFDVGDSVCDQLMMVATYDPSRYEQPLASLVWCGFPEKIGNYLARNVDVRPLKRVETSNERGNCWTTSAENCWTTSAENWSRENLSSDCITFALGGTFDGLHAGHLLAIVNLIRLVLKSRGCRFVGFGISSDEVLMKKKNPFFNFDYIERKKIVIRAMDYLLGLHGYRQSPDAESIPDSESAVRSCFSGSEGEKVIWCRRDVCDRIYGMFTKLGSDGIGFAGDCPELKVLVLTPEVIEGGHMVNKYREDRGLRPLKLYVSPLVSANSSPRQLCKKLSSRDLRGALEVFWVEWRSSEDRSELFSSLTEEEFPESLKKQVLRCLTIPYLMSFGEINTDLWQRRIDYYRTQHDRTQHDRTQHDRTQHDRTQHDRTQHDRTQHDRTQHDRTQHDRGSSHCCLLKKWFLPSGELSAIMTQPHILCSSVDVDPA